MVVVSITVGANTGCRNRQRCVVAAYGKADWGTELGRGGDD